MYSQIAMKNFYFFAKANLKEGFALAQYKTVTLKFSFLQSKKRTPKVKKTMSKPEQMQFKYENQI